MMSGGVLDISWWRHQMETFSALLAICVGNSPVPMNSPHKGQWRVALMFSLICVWINSWVNNGEVGDLRRYRSHYDVTVMWGPPQYRLSGMGIAIMKIRWSSDHLIFIMRIPLLVRRHLYIQMARLILQGWALRHINIPVACRYYHWACKFVWLCNPKDQGDFQAGYMIIFLPV